MTRDEAIHLIIVAWSQRDDEFLADPDEYAKSAADLDDALRALGVTDEEMNA